MSTTSVFLNNRQLCLVPAHCTVQHIYETVHAQLGLLVSEFYLHQHGRIADPAGSLGGDGSAVHVALRLRGGKGGFGSMLRAIGAQIEKTTNREACRDLSGRRLRDINEEKRLKTWLDGQPDRDQEAIERRKQKLARAQAQPKHVFEDKHYEQSRQELTQCVADSVEEGLRKAAEAVTARAHVAAGTSEAGCSGVKRKAGSMAAKKNKSKKKKSALWLGGDFSSDSESDDNDAVSSPKGANEAVVPAAAL